jgi:hypothetical protein
MEQTNHNESRGYQTRVEGGKAYIGDDLYIAENSGMSQYNAGSRVGSQAATVQGDVVNYNFFG